MKRESGASACEAEEWREFPCGERKLHLILFPRGEQVNNLL
jgi:hypothetical protein